MPQTEITLRTPDDWHLHLRDGDMLKAVIGHSSADFARAIIMPNLVPPVVTSSDARAYRDRILSAIPKGDTFEPLMTLYLTEGTDPNDVASAWESGLIRALKLYPAGATTNSDSGVRNIENVYPVLERMAALGIPLCLHGEVTDPAVDIFDREAVFIEKVLDPLRQRFPALRVIMEHVTTEDGVQYVEGGENIFATLTTHHLIINRNAILAGGIRPHYYCLPVAKREHHRLALRRAATGGDARFFLGTDSAPHIDAAKLSECGCAGIYTSINTLSCLAHVFEDEGALERLEGFASLHGPAAYGLEPNDSTIRMVRGNTPVSLPANFSAAGGTVTVFDPGFPLYWARVDKGASTEY